MSCGSDWALLWLFCRPAAVALMRSLAWEPPYARGVALKRQGEKKKKKTLHRISLTVLTKRGFFSLKLKPDMMGKGVVT